MTSLLFALPRPDLPVVRLKPKAEARAIRHGFPWIYADELVTDRRTQSLTPGALAVLEDADRRPMGSGHGECEIQDHRPDAGSQPRSGD